MWIRQLSYSLGGKGVSITIWQFDKDQEDQELDRIILIDEEFTERV